MGSSLSLSMAIGVLGGGFAFFNCPPLAVRDITVSGILGAMDPCRVSCTLPLFDELPFCFVSCDCGRVGPFFVMWWIVVHLVITEGGVILRLVVDAVVGEEEGGCDEVDVGVMGYIFSISGLSPYVSTYYTSCICLTFP